MSLFFNNFGNCNHNPHFIMKTKKARKSQASAARKSGSGDKCHTITAEVSIEVTGEDAPTKYDKRRHRWSVVAAWSLLALIVSTLCCLFAGLSVLTASITAASYIVFFVSLAGAGDIHSEEVRQGDYERYWGA